MIPLLRSNTPIALLYRIPILFLKPNSIWLESQSFPDFYRSPKQTSHSWQNNKVIN
jgi:hypothetical protein